MPKYIALLIVLLVGMQAPAQSDDLDEAYVNLFKLQLSLAKGGEANAQFGLGQMYEDGLGTDKDMTKALEWYGKAAKQGDIRAVKKLEDLSNPGQGIAKAAVRIAEPMKPKPVVTKETPKKVDEAAIRAEIEAKLRAEMAAKARTIEAAKKRAEVKELLEEKHENAKDPFE